MTARSAIIFLLIVIVITALVITARASSDPMPSPGDSTTAPETPVAAATAAWPIISNAIPAPGVTALRVKLRAEHARYLQAAHVVRQLRRVLMHKQSTREAMQLACATYGSCSTLWRRADCESGLNTNARNASGASGLFQFLPSTFASTPYGALSIFSPYANALAAGWMNAHGRGGEWVCR
jgi:hypothetical protein